MLMPKKTKYRRPHRVSYEGKSKGKNKINNGNYGLIAKEGAWITSQQIESARIAMTRHMKREGKVWLNIFPHLSLTRKPLEVRMGSGKGAPELWVAVVKKGKVLFEVSDLNNLEKTEKEALRLASHKLPIKTKIVKRGQE
ncbi:50S ribosomal protein L16 [Candidatus Phytoplasma pruni]|uniref:Large ribosomal subunit protein uL16 n=1 Tax=Candidatus Phytoplasma pruni TaxID=479893 RepID=A0A0M1MZZ8_9MOLU|nr:MULTISPECIES: 50S ribosomal protein L16 [16SrIII (X-disease group)]KOR75482.1 50S ribosomal protein L16 [Candidatus Phytoplasma pruni]MCQ9618664.1 50S ribosomal protein L16 [Candidatus Phytoplasma pruni]MDW3617808.1 50S ribosomal protein L16 [Candidatus Phytoplasma pruni]WEK82379.1 MAG: 50S ribosomal protein L16 [Candidatus Phytoplasma pruni]